MPATRSIRCSRSGGPPPVAERAVIGVCAVPIVEEEGELTVEHRVPAASLALGVAVAHTRSPLRQGLTVEVHTDQGVGAHHHDLVALRREPRHGGLGDLEGRNGVQVDRVEHQQLGVGDPLWILAWPRPGEVLGHELAAGKGDEAVVGHCARQRDAGLDLEVRRQAMGVVPEDDVE